MISVSVFLAFFLPGDVALSSIKEAEILGWLYARSVRVALPYVLWAAPEAKMMDDV